jgi:phage gpG-like protein
MKTKEGLPNFEAMGKGIQNLIEALPHQIGSKAEELINDSFEQQKYSGKAGTSKWESRKKEDKGSTSSRPILVGKGGGTKLVNSFNYQISKDAVEIHNPKVYASVHNEGLTIPNRNGSTNMPKRQFAPVPGEEWQALDQAMEKFIDKSIDQIL